MLGPEGGVPSALVFSEFPWLRSFVGPIIPRASLAARALVAQAARRYMAHHLAQVRVKPALHFQTPQETDQTYQTGDKVHVWREKLVENRIGEWSGPYTLYSYDAAARIMLVQKDPESPYERYNITQIITFVGPVAMANNFVESIASGFNYFSTPSEAVSTHDTEVIDKNDFRAHSAEMHEAILSTVRDLLRRGAFKVIPKSELPEDANALTARFALAIKSKAEGNSKYKARFVIVGHGDSLKHYLVHRTQTLEVFYARLLIALALAHNFDVWSSDVKLEYLQSAEPLTRRVFINNPAPEFQLDPDKCFELLKPLYGISDAGDFWHMTLNKYLINELCLMPNKNYPSLYFSFRRRELIGINGSYVDDLLRAGAALLDEMLCLQ